MRLISFLGTGLYGETQYTFEGKTHRTKYVAEALATFTGVNEIHVLATKEAWETHGEGLTIALTNAHCPTPVRVAMPTGGDSAQLWEMFGAIVSTILTSPPNVLLDITHGFRSQPFFAAACVQYVHAVMPNPPRIRAVYGEFLKDRDSNPIWELTPFLEVLSWSRSLMMFLRTGLADEVVTPTKALGDVLRRDWFVKGKVGPEPQLGRLASALRDFSDDFTSIRTGSLLAGETSSAQRLFEAITNTKVEVAQHLPTLEPILDQVQAMIEPLLTHGQRLSSLSGQMSLYALARLYQKMERYSEAASLLREGWITLGAPPTADHPGQKNGYNADSRKQQEQFWQEHTTENLSVSQLRNDLQHAGFNLDPQNKTWFERELDKYLAKWLQAIDAMRESDT